MFTSSGFLHILCPQIVFRRQFNFLDENISILIECLYVKKIKRLHLKKKREEKKRKKTKKKKRPSSSALLYAYLIQKVKLF